MATINPYTMARTKTDPQTKKWGPVVAERLGVKVDEVNRIMNAAFLTEAEQVKRVRYAQMFAIAEASAYQAKFVLEKLAEERGISRETFAKAMMSGEALAGGVNSMSDIATFITQTIHMSLDIWPRLLANELVSMQPLTQAGGYVFFQRHYDQTGRELSDLELFDPDFTEDPGEGADITDKVRTHIDSQFVEAVYRKIMHEETWEAEVKARTQFNIDLESVNDSLMARQLMWTIDRTVINDLVASAWQDYYFDPTAGGAYAGMDEINKHAYDENFIRLVYNRAETDMEATVFRKPTWAIAGSEAINFLKRLRKFETRKNGTSYGDLVLGNGSVTFAGQMDDLNVWHDPQLDQCLMLIGTVEKMDPFYAGYIFAPFSAGGILTQAFRDPTNLKNRKSMAMAFAKVVIRRRQFARIWLQHCS